MARSRMSWRTPVLLVYCAFLAAGASFLAAWSDPAEHRFKAVRPMAVNHVVQKGDLVAESEGVGDPSELTGRFARTFIRQDEIVRASDFGPAPLLRAPGRVTIELPFAGAVGNANAGDPVALCKGAEDLKLTTPAAALMCDGDGAQRKNCAAIVQLQPQEASKVLGEVSRMVAKPASQGCSPEARTNSRERTPSR